MFGFPLSHTKKFGQPEHIRTVASALL